MPSMPSNEAEQYIPAHGGAIGLVGVALVNKRLQILKRPFVTGKSASSKLNRAGDKAADSLIRGLEKAAEILRSRGEL